MIFRNLIFAMLVAPGYPFITPTLAAKRPTNNNHQYAFSNTEGMNSLSVTELKRLLSERGIDFRDCLEKQELVQRLQDSAGAPRNTHPVSGGLSPQEQSLISTFKRVSPSVSHIKTTNMAQQQRGLSLRGLEVPEGSGSGFLWDNNGHVVTNFHVISGGRPDAKNLPKVVKVKLAGRVDVLEADVIGVEPEKDLAVLKVRDAWNLPNPIDVGTSNDLQVGQSVIAIGNPFGLDDTLTTGIVSALGRDVDGIGGRYDRS